MAFENTIAPENYSREVDLQMPGGETVRFNAYLGPKLAVEVAAAIDDLERKLFVTDDENPTSKTRVRHIIYVDEEGYVGLMPV